MTFLIDALILLIINLFFALINLLTWNKIVSWFYSVIGFNTLPKPWVQWIFTGLFNILIYVGLYLIIKRELHIAVNDNKHKLHNFILKFDSLIKCKGESWPPVFLLPASFLHLISVILVFTGKLRPGLWWLLLVLIFGFWAQYYMGLVKQHSALPNKENVEAESQPIKEIQSDEFKAIDFLGYLKKETWFRDQIVYQIPWPGELPPDADASWKDSVVRFNGSHDKAAPESQQKLFQESDPLRELADAITGNHLINHGLYSHQGKVMDLLQTRLTESEKPMHVLISTPVGSGRTTINYISALYEVLYRHQSVLLIFSEPKMGRVLSSQLIDIINESKWNWFFSIATYWSDDEPRMIRKTEKANNEFVNPDILVVDLKTLHEKLLPNHEHWSQFFEQFGLIIVENMENYVNVYGANAAMIFLRLMRIADYYHTKPQILATGLKTNNLDYYFRDLFSLRPEEFHVKQIVDEDGRHKNQKQIIFWNNEHFVTTVDDLEPKRKNFKDGLNKILTHLVRIGAKTVLINKTASVCSSDVAAINQEIVENLQFELKKDIDIFIGSTMEAVYDRDVILKQANPASFDAAVVTGIPGSIWMIMHDLEHLGDDNGQDLVPIVIALPGTPLQQYLSKKAPEVVISLINRASSLLPKFNPFIQKNHLIYSLSELPATKEEIVNWFGTSGETILNQILQDGILNINKIPKVEKNSICLVDEYAIDNNFIERCAIDGINLSNWVLEANEKVISDISDEQIGLSIYNEAIIVLFDKRYQITKLDIKNKRITAFPLTETSSTERIIETSCELRTEKTQKDYQVPIIKIQLEDKSLSIFTAGVLDVEIEEKILGCQVYDSFSYDRKGGVIKIDPALTREKFETKAYFIGVPDADIKTLHTITHLLITLAPIYLLKEPAFEIFVKDKCEIFTDIPAIVVYDSIPGGSGVANWFSQSGNLKSILKEAFNLLVACPCTSGCSNCIEIHNCHHRDLSKEGCELDKNGAIILLGKMLNINTETLIKHRNEKMELAEQISRIKNEIVEFIFPHKLDLFIKEVASLRVVDSLHASVIGTYNPSNNEVQVLKAKEEEIITVLAHEYAHNWQWKGEPSMAQNLMDPNEVPYFNGKLFIEGFAQFIEYKVADYYGFQRVMKEIHFRHYDEYSEGFQVLIWIQDNFGSNKVYEFIRSGHLIIDNKEISLDEMLERSNVKNRLTDLEEKYKTNPPDEDIIHGDDKNN